MSSSLPEEGSLPTMAHSTTSSSSSCSSLSSYFTPLSSPWRGLPRQLPSPIPRKLAVGIINAVLPESSPPIISATSIPSTCCATFHLRDLSTRLLVAHIYTHHPHPSRSFRRASQLLALHARLDTADIRVTPRQELRHSTPTYFIIVHEPAAAPSVELLVSLLGRPFRMQTLFQVALTSLKALEKMHKLNIVHANLSPQTMHLQRMGEGCEVLFSALHHLQRASKCRRFIRTENQSHCLHQYQDHLYSSVEVEGARYAGRKDDLQAWIYIMVFIAKGRLGWESVVKERRLQMKLDLSNDGVFSGVPHVFKELFQEFRAFRENEGRLSYKRIRSKLKRAAEEYRRSDDWQW